MVCFHQTLTHLLSQAAIALFFVILAMAKNAQSQSDATSFYYDFYGEKPTGLTLQGDAHFLQGDAHYLRLTKTDAAGTPQQSSVGRAVYSTPVQFWREGAQVDFETTLKFRITPKANSNNPADGLVFFMAPVGFGIPNDAQGGNFGIFGSSGNSSSVFAVEFDIYVNGQWDPNFRHVGIDIESRSSVSVAQLSDSLIGREVTMRVNYVEATRMITAVVTAGSERFEVSYEHDLSNILPQQVHVGLAASTGEYVAIYDVVSWYFTSTLVQQRAQGRRNCDLIGSV